MILSLHVERTSLHAVSDLTATREVNRVRDQLFRAIGSAPDAAKAA